MFFTFKKGQIPVHILGLRITSSNALKEGSDDAEKDSFDDADKDSFDDVQTSPESPELW